MHHNSNQSLIQSKTAVYPIVLCSIQTFSEAKPAFRYMFYKFFDMSNCTFHVFCQCTFSLDTSMEMTIDVNYHIFNVERERERVLLVPFQHKNVSSDKDTQHQIYFTHIAEHF